MIPLESLELTKALVITGICVGTLGLISIWVGLRYRWSNPPMWTLDYRGWSSPQLAHLWAAIFLTGFWLIPLSPFVPMFVFRVLGTAMFAGMFLWFLGMLVWFPRFLTPLWYQRARRAGVNPRSPQAVQRFRELPVETQKRLAKTRGALPDGRDPAAVGTEGLEPPTAWV